MEKAFKDMDLRQLKALLADGLALCDNPEIRLSVGEINLAGRYLTLGKIILEAGLPGHPSCSSRAKEVFDRFLRLLTDYCSRERSVGFYADKLCMTPKYLSRLVREASGRGAPEWIDTYVILEARNYLKYSDLSIKQIVAQLHFPDQPTFTKYFKAHTGRTPAQFRKESAA